MKIEIACDLIEKSGMTETDMLVLRTQREADKWLSPAEVAQLTGLPEEAALASTKKLTELMMLTKVFR